MEGACHIQRSTKRKRTLGAIHPTTANTKDTMLWKAGGNSLIAKHQKDPIEMSAAPLLVQAAEAMIAVGRVERNQVEHSKTEQIFSREGVSGITGMTQHERIPSLAPPFCAFPAPPKLAQSFSMPHILPQIKYTMPTVSLSTIGIGIDSAADVDADADQYHGTMKWNATEAAIRALRDAVDRSTLRQRMQHTLQVHVRLGVPGDPQAPTTPMAIDMNKLTDLLPSSVTVAPISVVIGGLFVPGATGQDNALCTVVACLTMQFVTSAMNQQSNLVSPPPPEIIASDMPTCLSIQIPTPLASGIESPMDMLAQISEEVRERSLEYRQVQSSGIKESTKLHMLHYNHQRDEASPDHQDDTSETTTSTTVLTVKNNRRHVVQHAYNDHSQEQSNADDGALLLAAKAFNSAFPIKLHEALSRVDADGNDHILSWQPHGRAFKIHKQHEFEHQILPQYFVMTKKSSFLRQLNLYGFHRLSGGRDKGAYYHELFLKGMPFLSRRIVRQKVNGNGIRAAGNPTQEPNFYKMPLVPLLEEEPHSSSPVVATMSTDEDDEGSVDEQSTEGTSVDSEPPVEFRHISFPLKLHTMLDSMEAQGLTDTISWMPHGRGFIVHQQEIFTNNIITQFFRQTKYSSFQRQLHMYSFQRISMGKDKGCYYHPKFLRGQPDLCRSMQRTRVNGKGCRKPAIPSHEPNFWSMPTIPPVVSTRRDLLSLTSPFQKHLSSPKNDDETEEETEDDTVS